MKALTRSAIAAVVATVLAAPAGAEEIAGAGSTFAFPIISKWSQAYRQVQAAGEFPAFKSGLDDPRSQDTLDYEPIGSTGGMMRVKERAVDFGASDVPLQSAELEKLGLAQFPLVMGGVAAVVNIDGVASNQLKLTGPLLADIYLGKIQSWSDAAIKAVNPDLKLPDAKIAVVRRADGSGTTFNFTTYLSQVSPEWQQKVGADTSVAWPTGTGARGSEGVAQTVARTKNSIGYVEYANAAQLKLATAQVQNSAGKFVTPNGRSFQSAASSANWDKAKDFYLMLTNAPGDEAYPIVATTFALMPRQGGTPRRARATLDFFGWALEKGGKDAADLGYVPLPDPLVKQVREYWTGTFKVGM